MIAAAEKELAGLQAQIAQHDLKTKENQRLEKLISGAREERDSLELELKAVQKELAENEKLLSRESAIREQMAVLEALKSKMDEWELKRKKFSELRGKRHQAEISLNRKITEKEKTLDLLTSKITAGRERLA